MINCHRLVTVHAGHGFGGDQRVDDGLFRCLNRGKKDRIEIVVAERFNGCRAVVVGGLVAGAEGKKNITGAVAGIAAVAGKAERGAFCQSRQLMRQQRCIGANHDDDRTGIAGRFVDRCTSTRFTGTRFIVGFVGSQVLANRQKSGVGRAKRRQFLRDLTPRHPVIAPCNHAATMPLPWGNHWVKVAGDR